jgi:hypothetical protein
VPWRCFYTMTISVSHPDPLRLTDAQGNNTLTTRILNTMFSQACGCQTDKYWGLGSEPDAESRSSPPYIRRVRHSADIFFSPHPDCLGQPHQRRFGLDA